ncbi:armadillo-type protein [Pelagophyceae sp. CCMP2097]|nr:armadillo-type protein [Pelagophyceae sp. CCMP2097]
MAARKAVCLEYVDIDVKNGANLLDRLIKDIVTESPTFEIAPFIPLLQKYIRRSNPYIRQLVVGWITVLDSVPDITMLDWLPDFLDGLFAMLSDSNREIRSAAEAAINGFLVDIANSKTVEFGPMVPILVDQCRAQDRARRCTAVTWVRQFIELGKSALLLFYSELLGSIMHCIADTDVEIRKKLCPTRGQIRNPTVLDGIADHHLATAF